MIISSRHRIGQFVDNPTLGLKLDGRLIENKKDFKYLGLNIDSFLNFDLMVDNVCSRSRVSMTQRVRFFLPSSYLHTLYFSFIQPYIDYCILVWGFSSKTNISKVQRLQNRVACIVSQCFDFNVSSLEMIKSLRWQNVTERRDFLCSILMHKCLYGHAPSYLSDHFVTLEAVPDRFTRLSNELMLHVPFARTNYLNRSFSIIGPKSWNNLPTDLRRIQNLDQFKNMYKQLIL